MNDQDKAKEARDTYFIEARLHWDRHHVTDDGTHALDPSRKYVQLDGGQDARGAVHKPLWPRLVKFAWQHNVEPALLIKAVFANRTDRQLPPANLFVSRAALESCQRFQSEHAIDVEYEFKSFKAEARRLKWELEQTLAAPLNVIWRLVIVDPMLSYGPLYRYVLALELNEEDLALRYRHSALMEYVTSPDEFNKVMGEHLPAEFKADGRRLREKFKHV